ncbi:MAG TPA: alanine/ornithine racemase family PLP-dependent enzyme [Cyclobacteriaceae bacterium]
MGTPRLEINLSKIAHNVRTISDLYGSKGINVAAITKGVCGDPVIADIIVKNGIDVLGDSRMANIRHMIQAGIDARFILIRTPFPSQLEEVVKYAHLSFNSELAVIKSLSTIALASNKTHHIILMMELGDLREGVMPNDMPDMVKEILKLEGIKLEGIGTNLSCHSGIKPDDEKMKTLSWMATSLEDQFNIKLSVVSGGSSANYDWFNSTNDVGRINQLRIGESILLGVEPIGRHPIEHLYTDAFTLFAEVIESKIKPSLPYGDVGQDVFGNIPVFEDKGKMKRAILGLGRQDMYVSALTPQLDVDILGASSDHMIINCKQQDIKTGNELAFNLNYAALLSAMTSPYVTKKMSKYDERPRVLSNGRAKRFEAKITQSNYPH